MARSTDDLIHELASDLPPVKPMRRLREVVLMALGISLPFYAYRLATAGLNDPVSGVEMPGAMFLLVSVVLVIVAIGGMLAGLAGAIPGREFATRLGVMLCIGALAIAVVLFGYALLFESEPFIESARSSVGCATGAGLLAIPAAWFVTRFVVRGAARKVSNAVALAVAGGMGVAAAVVHASCAHPESLHLVMGHAFAPFAVGLLVLCCASVYFAISGLKRGGAPTAEN